jgi:Protein of unknown function (DUF2380)
MKFRTLRIFLWAAILPALLAPVAGRSEPKPPIKLAVFDFELDDFSAGGTIGGESAAETAMLQRVTALAKERLAQSGLFEIIDGNASTNEMVRTHWLRKCNGCEAAIARDLGADMSFIAYFRKVSIMEQFLEFRIRDAHSGELMNLSHTDLRGETDESWSRAIIWLLRYRLVEPLMAQQGRELSR